VRVVVDTNTVVSAFLWGGLPAEILAAAREGRITLLTSATRLAELEDVLEREKFADRIAQVGSSAAQMIAGYRALATPVRPAVIEPTVRDPDDDHVLACALGAQAALIVTRDRDLLSLGAFRDIPILAALARRSTSSPPVPAESLVGPFGSQR
jgi:putative PIN family toxin of toxin-antitoxin system